MKESKIVIEMIKNNGDCRTIACSECPFLLNCDYEPDYHYLSNTECYDLSIRLYKELYGVESLMEILL